jgi:hypothetical protein
VLFLAALAACAGLHGSFSVVPGSAGAGNIVYALRLRNEGATPCSVPTPRLLGKSGAPLPTHVSWRSTVIRPGGHATATARFSPDVPGVGEQVSGPCEPVAHSLRLGPAVVPIRPPTRVCEHGRLSFRPFH